MFQFPGFASSKGYPVFNWMGCPIRKSTDYSLCAATRGLSQLITSFIASKIQGILHMPLFAFLICNYKMFKKFLNIPTYFYDS